MSVIIVTGSAGLIGSEAVRAFHGTGREVWDIDDMRRSFFGPEASTVFMRDRLIRELPRYNHLDTDIRNRAALDRIFDRLGKNLRP